MEALSMSSDTTDSHWCNILEEHTVNAITIFSVPRKQTQYVPQACWNPPVKQHVALTQKILAWIFNAVKFMFKILS